MMQCTIQDEYGKINVNALVIGSGEKQAVLNDAMVEALRAFFVVRGLEETPIAAIIDWLDEDDEVTELDDSSGAESDYYDGLEPPYSCKDGPMDSIEELLLIKGVTKEVFFGLREEEQLPLNELFTVHGHPEGRINVNTAPFEVLEAYFAALGEVSPTDSADSLMAQIEEQGPFTSYQDIVSGGWVKDPAQREEQNPPPPPDPPDPNNPAQPRDLDRPPPILFDTISSGFRIHGDGQSGDSLVRVEAFIWRDSPTSTGDTSGAEQTFRILDWRVIR